MSALALTNRKMSGFPVSIGTGLALESIFNRTRDAYDQDRMIPQKVDINDYETFWINVTTLFRNLQSSVDREVFNQLTPEAIFTTLLQEMDVINHLVAENGNEVRVRYYYSTYSDLIRKVKMQAIPLIALRLPKTPNQMFSHDIQIKILQAIRKQTDDFFKMTGALIPDRSDKSLVLTHQPYDLTDYKRFESLHLIESNTGILKPRTLWSTKYYAMPGLNSSPADMGRLPFHRKLLLVFGDRSLIVPTQMPIRRHIYKVAVDRNWAASTTMDKVNLDLELSFKDAGMAAAWKSF